ncbi:radical SAM family heme chaperone HemW [bacterium]|nr:radical SAM family heme chaperone HemW [bacterium]
MAAVHVYVHVPFCVDPCGYCDFYRGRYRSAGEAVYREALVREIGLRVPEGAVVRSLYFGGGTPSLLTEAGWTAIFNALTARASFETGAEISIEANPASVTKENARMWRTLGVNRVSVGVQSLNNRILRFLNRLHNARQALAALDCLAAAGFQNVSADLIYAIPGQNLRDLRGAVRHLAPSLRHLSAYALAVEPGTPFARRGVVPQSPDQTAAQYEIILETAGLAGLRRYEISNFARPGYECSHNLNTWAYGALIGLGPSAVGFDGRRRYRNVPDIRQYSVSLRRGALPESFEESPGTNTRLRERLMSGLRTRDGTLLSTRERSRLQKLSAEAGLSDCFEWPESGARLKSSKWLVLDEILARLPAEEAVVG